MITHFESIIVIVSSHFDLKGTKRKRELLSKPIKMQHLNFAFIVYREIITNTCTMVLNCNNYLTCESTVSHSEERTFLFFYCMFFWFQHKRFTHLTNGYKFILVLSDQLFNTLKVLSKDNEDSYKC